MTIESTAARPIIALGVDGTIQRLVIELGDVEADARDVERDATDRRFDAAEEALDRADEAVRRTAVHGILGGLGQVAAGVTSAVAAASRAVSDASSPSDVSEPGATPAPEGAATPPAQTAPREGPSTAGRILLSSVDDALGLGATFAQLAAGRSGVARDRATLESQREQARADAADQRARRERATHDGLLQQLDQLTRERRESEQRSISAIGGR